MARCDPVPVKPATAEWVSGSPGAQRGKHTQTGPSRRQLSVCERVSAPDKPRTLPPCSAIIHTLRGTTPRTRTDCGRSKPSAAAILDGASLQRRPGSRLPAHASGSFSPLHTAPFRTIRRHKLHTLFTPHSSLPTPRHPRHHASVSPLPRPSQHPSPSTPATHCPSPSNAGRPRHLPQAALLPLDLYHHHRRRRPCLALETTSPPSLALPCRACMRGAHSHQLAASHRVRYPSCPRALDA